MQELSVSDLLQSAVVVPSPEDVKGYAARLDQALSHAGIPRGRSRVPEMARRFNVTPETARQWTLGRMPTLPRFCAIATHLGVSFDWLATGRGHMISHIVAEAPAEYLVVADREFERCTKTMSSRKKRAMMDLLDPRI
jgi:transcriptional regulator with XRE-family HTH domain